MDWPVADHLWRKSEKAPHVKPAADTQINSRRNIVNTYTLRYFCDKLEMYADAVLNKAVSGINYTKEEFP